jgi:hypothetical protein
MIVRIYNLLFVLLFATQLSSEAVASKIEYSEIKTNYIGCGTVIDITRSGIEKEYFSILGKFNFYEGKDITASIRPTVLIDIDHLIYRIPLTLNLNISGEQRGNWKIDLFAGGGIGNDYYDYNEIYPIILGGVDIYWKSIALLLPGINMTIKKHDTDTEIVLGLGFRL